MIYPSYQIIKIVVGVGGYDIAMLGNYYEIRKERIRLLKPTPKEDTPLCEVGPSSLNIETIDKIA
jgi:hypothetical protein